MDFPTLHTNFWDVVIAVPIVMVLKKNSIFRFKNKRQKNNFRTET